MPWWYVARAGLELVTFGAHMGEKALTANGFEKNPRRSLTVGRVATLALQPQRRPPVPRALAEMTVAPPGLGQEEITLWGRLLRLGWLDGLTGEEAGLAAIDAAGTLALLHTRRLEHAGNVLQEMLRGRVIWAGSERNGVEAFELDGLGAAIMFSTARGLAYNTVGVCKRCDRVFLKDDRQRLSRAYCRKCSEATTPYSRRKDSLPPVQALYENARHALQQRNDVDDSTFKDLRALYDAALKHNWSREEFSRVLRERFDYPRRPGRKPANRAR